MPVDGVPTSRELSAAYWAGRAIGAGELAAERRRQSYLALPVGGRLDLADFEVAEQLLIDAELLVRSSGCLLASEALTSICLTGEATARELLLVAVLESSAPVWLMAAASGERLRVDLVPEGAQSAVEDLFDDPDAREAFLLARGRKVEERRLAEIGSMGEEAVVREARAELGELGYDRLAGRVRQVSQISDELGYDVVAPRADGSPRRLEVKTVAASTTEVSFYLSRNEARVGQADPDWSLVVCALVDEQEAHVVGWVAMESIAPLLPQDADERASWQSAKIKLDAGSLKGGLPPAAVFGLA